MNGKNFIKKVLKNLIIFILICIIWFTLWMGFSFILCKIFGENENIQLIVTVIVSMILGLTIGIKVVKKTKNLQIEKKQNVIENQLATITGIIAMLVTILVICIIFKSKVGIIISLSFIGALLLWELGAFLAYKNLQKDIELINKKLKEK